MLPSFEFPAIPPEYAFEIYKELFQLLLKRQSLPLLTPPEFLHPEIAVLFSAYPMIPPACVAMPFLKEEHDALMVPLFPQFVIMHAYPYDAMPPAYRKPP